MHNIANIPQPTFSLLGDADNLFAGFFAPPAARGIDAPALDIIETADGYVVKADLPGVKQEDLLVNVKENVLTIEAETRDERDAEDASVIASERRTGKYRRALRLGKSVDAGNIRAAYHDGVLTLTLPRAAEAEGRKINIEAH
ncbi:MAG: Hsp20/alpha crystallin family protein [Gammaproteobacteria bacterium]